MNDGRNLSELIDSSFPMAGFFVALLAVAIVLLVVSMNRQMKKVNPDLPMGRGEKRLAADARYQEEAEKRGADEERDA